MNYVKWKTTTSTKQGKNDANEVKKEVQIEHPYTPPGKTSRRSVRIVHQKNLCIWCMKRDDSPKYPEWDKFYKIFEDKFWKKFKASVMYVQDPELKLKIIDVCKFHIQSIFHRNIVVIHDSYQKKISDLYVVLMKLVNEICKM